jgi:Outer membrane protein beta-barrel domain
MKKTIALLLILATLQAKAQFQIGLSTSGYKSQAYNKQDDSMPNVHLLNTIKGAIGINALYNISPRIAIGTELSYFTSGQKYQCDSFGSSLFYNSDMTLKYFNVPLYLQFNLFINSRFNIFLQAGGYYANLITFKEVGSLKVKTFSGESTEATGTVSGKKISSVEIRTLTNGTVINTSQTYTYENYIYSNTDYGVQGAIGTSYKLNNKITLCGNLFYKYGFADIEKTDPINIYNDKGKLDGRYSIKWEFPYKYATISTSTPLRSKTNNINMGLQIGVLYKF